MEAPNQKAMYTKPELMKYDSLRDLTARCSPNCESPTLWYSWTTEEKP